MSERLKQLKITQATLTRAATGLGLVVIGGLVAGPIGVAATLGGLGLAAQNANHIVQRLWQLNQEIIAEEQRIAEAAQAQALLAQQQAERNRNDELIRQQHLLAEQQRREGHR